VVVTNLKKELGGKEEGGGEKSFAKLGLPSLWCNNPGGEKKKKKGKGITGGKGGGRGQKKKLMTFGRLSSLPLTKRKGRGKKRGGSAASKSQRTKGKKGLKDRLRNKLNGSPFNRGGEEKGGFARHFRWSRKKQWALWGKKSTFTWGKKLNPWGMGGEGKK